MLAEIKEFVKAHVNDIMLFIIVVLLILFAFAAGYIMGKQQLKEPLQITNQSKI